MARSTATALFWRGLLAAGIDLIRAFSRDRAGPALGYLPPAVLSFAAAFGALTWPGVTAPVLTAWVAAWAPAIGVMEVALSFRHGGSAGERAMWPLSGLVSIVLGFMLAARPDSGAVTLATVFGAFGIRHGAFVPALSARTRRTAPYAARPSTNSTSVNEGMHSCRTRRLRPTRPPGPPR
ncbi:MULTISPECIES: HdeD family acid-resistance protein [unclassified Streptomyces]|uniref:HdeD family acid-resistance protein n=1 Tax=unclassified Streptomyces TaxID=2593676 RepID=UPI00371F52A8